MTKLKYIVGYIRPVDSALVVPTPSTFIVGQILDGAKMSTTRELLFLVITAVLQKGSWRS